ncbi:hypothetical protein H0A36_26480 [Endozoicomonas sp. SM1973]|uniref:Uncharacterized protein n=1 Tax=Spartinivicinus marinus TaxID=2994442 RepID=A0A853INX4_9GAMM|nr:hypothetical protein [Spartinivicinus marinus]MCX4030233.1 hypothetical protein [Spartinivicinus marinus]NYZ69566.1 hypothetical protein [Spartinivicinus marinus]
MKAEEIITKKILSEFTVDNSVTDDWIESNAYTFEGVSLKEAIKYLPSFMIYVLRTFRSDQQSMVYMQLLFTLNEYSKCKNAGDSNLGLWFMLNSRQKVVVLDFLVHILHNQSANIDEGELRKIVRRWTK